MAKSDKSAFLRQLNLVQRPRHLQGKRKRCYKCQVCPKSFQKMVALARHVVDAHVEDKEFQCSICLKAFLNAQELRRHRQKRHFTDSVSGTCDQCGQSFKWWKSLRAHTRKLHDQFDICKLCEKSFPDESNWDLHRRSGMSWPCPDQTCSEEFRSMCFRDQHVARIHLGRIIGGSHRDLEGTEEEDQDDIISIFYCEHCPSTFTQQLHLKAHERAAHPRVIWSCQKCSETFRAKYLLKKHQEKHLTERLFPCPVCSKAFKTRGSLATHEKIHVEERPHKCDLCSKSFLQPRFLRRHQANSHGTVEKPFKCPQCPARFFTRRALLKEHMPAHSQDRPFSCDQCFNTFKSRKTLLSHRRRTHNLRLIDTSQGSAGTEPSLAVRIKREVNYQFLAGYDTS